MPHYRRAWNETRADEHDSWGRSVWWFETDGDGSVTRQIEVYEQGPTVRYGPGRERDEIGMLADQPLDLEEFAEFEVSQTDFETAWAPADHQ
jgi:hypothetical protein